MTEEKMTPLRQRMIENMNIRGLPVIQQQDRIGPARNTMIFALTTYANLKLTPLCGAKKTSADHALT